jgi:hypothetical protein
MKSWKLNQKIDTLSKKLNDTTSENTVRLDFESFSEAEKLLFQKIAEIREEYQRTGNIEVLEKNANLVEKDLEVILTRVIQLFSDVVPRVLGCEGNFEVAEYFFQLHFRNFIADLGECLTQVGTWSDEDRKEFIDDLRKNGSFFFRLPRGINEYYGEKTGNSEKPADDKLDLGFFGSEDILEQEEPDISKEPDNGRSLGIR